MSKEERRVEHRESKVNPGHWIYACYVGDKQIDTFYVVWEADAWMEKWGKETKE